MLQQAARAVRQQVAARVGVASSSKAPSALRAAAVVPRAQAAAAAAFHSAAAPLASASASSQRDEQAHSSSSASASSLSASSIALLGALVSSVGGVWLLRSNEVAAEAAAVGMPEVAAASDASTLDAAPRKKKKKGSKKRGAAAVTDSDPRPTLANPGKLSQFHSSISEVTNIQTWQGLQIVWVSQAWPQGGGNELMSKQVQLQVVGGMGGPQGDWAQMQLNTSLGHAHGFEGVIATGGVVQGGYTLSALDQKLTIKPSFQLTPNGNGCELSADYRGQEWTANLGIHPMQADLSFAFSHALTKSLSMGSELHLSLVNPAHLNAGIKYKTKKESWALSKKDSAYQASSVDTHTTHAAHNTALSSLCLAFPPAVGLSLLMIQPQCIDHLNLLICRQKSQLSFAPI